VTFSFSRRTLLHAVGQFGLVWLVGWLVGWFGLVWFGRLIGWCEFHFSDMILGFSLGLSVQLSLPYRRVGKS
jgi:hypothetical protein